MFVYILYSRSLKKYYVGQTKKLDVRLKRHNTGREKFTSRGVPWKLVLSIDIDTRSDAMKLENKIKKRGIRRFLDDNQFGV